MRRAVCLVLLLLPRFALGAITVQTIPNAGMVRACATNGTAAYVGTETAGLWQGTTVTLTRNTDFDAALGWTPLPTPVATPTPGATPPAEPTPAPQQAVTALYASGTSLYVGTGEFGLWKSTDTGATFARLTGVSDAFVMSVLHLGTTTWAGTTTGLYHSDDDVTFARSGTFAGPVLGLGGAGTTLLAGTPDGVWRSTDSGGTWALSNTGLDTHYVEGIVLVSTTAYAVTGGGGLYKSTDGGATWVKISGIPPVLHGVTATSATVSVLVGRNAFRATANGSTWTTLNAGLEAGELTCVARTGTVIVAGTDDGRVVQSR